MSAMGVVFKKEVMDNLRDRRSIWTVIATAMVTPLLLVGLILVMGRVINPNSDETPLQLPVVGAENAPALVVFLQQAGVQVVPAPQDPQAAVKNGALDVVLVIPKDYGDHFTQGEPAPLELILDTSRMSASPAIQRVQNLLNGYERQVSTLRLMARGVNPQITTVLQIKNNDLSTPQSQSLLFLNMLPFFLIMVIFMGGMYVVIDATAGERERGSLEPLLINPVRRSSFVLGKLLASLPFALGILILSLGVIGAAFNLIPMEEFTGFSMTVGLDALWTIFLICLPLLLLAGGLQVVLAAFTHSFKEAQTYLSFLPLVAGFPSAFLVFLPAQTNRTLMLIPAYGQSLLINQVMRGEYIDPLNLTISAVTTLALSILVVLAAVRLYQREALLFGAK
jgi:sodium transport system permease protein